MIRSLALALVLLATGCGTEGTPRESTLANGIYEVVARASTQGELPARGRDTRALIYDHRFVQGGSEEPPEYLLLRTRDFVPLDLAEPPTSATVEGRPVLWITLEGDAGKALTALTTHVKRIAIVIGGEVTSSHVVRVPLEGGKLQVSC